MASSSTAGRAPVQHVNEETTDDLPLSSLFDNEDFDAISWLNSCLPSSPTGLNSLSRAVEESLHTAHLSLDRSLSHALSAVPWAVRESEKVRQRANTLRASVDGVGERVAGVEAGVASAVDTLARADDVVRRVESVSLLLAQTAEAERLQSRLSALLSSAGSDGADLVTAADVLARLRATLAPLADIPQLQSRVRALDTADARLEALAAPQLRRALEERNGPAAANARVVFDRAGRENAFVAQYVAIRAAQVAKLWATAWDSWASADMGDEKMNTERNARRAMRGDISVEGAEVLLSAFYANLLELIQTEKAWLDTAFPDLRLRLLPSLLVAALADVRSPALRPPAPGTSDASRETADRMHAAARLGVEAAARICGTILPEWGDELFNDDGFAELAAEAMTAALAPHRLFLGALADMHSRAARTATGVLVLATEAFFLHRATPNGPAAPEAPKLSEVARDVEKCAIHAVGILDEVFPRITEQTVGIGMDAMTRVAGTVVSELSRRLLRMLKHGHLRQGGGESDEWARISGALRLLQATSTLKREWDLRKDTGLATAFGLSTSAIAKTALTQVELRLRQFIEDANSDRLDMAATVWELIRDTSLIKRVYSTFECTSTADFNDVLQAAHRVVYDNLLAGVHSRFIHFAKSSLWAAGDDDTTLGSSPLPYATEVADFLMTVPQQLEPFVPEDDHEILGTPKNVFAFSKTRQIAPLDDEAVNTSFAGMWIHVLAVGTMELYVEKICGIPKLSDLGTRQLAVDTEYMCNVLSALGVNPTAEMALVRRLLECTADATAFEKVAGDVVAADLRKVVRRVAAVRGVSVTL